MLILSFLGPCVSKLEADLVVVSNSHHPNITFYRDPGRHPNLHCLSQSPQWLCEVEDIITVIFRRRKPESTKVQSRAGIWTRSSDFKLELLWFEHHHCEYLPFDWKNTNIGACSIGGGALGSASLNLALSYLLSFPDPSFISVPYLGLCSCQMNSPFSFLSSFISSLHKPHGSGVLLVAQPWIRQSATNRWTQHTFAVKGRRGDRHILKSIV